jgi:LmbE family N-acetylglucosaminyl deacetylase
MTSFRFPFELQSVLCVGAHPDDIEIGAGGTIAAIAAAQPQARFSFIVFTSDIRRRKEAVSSAQALLGERVEVHVGEFEDGYLPYRDPAGAKDFLRSSIARQPDLVFGPCRGDLHQDHRFVAEMLGQVCRQQPILGYEIVKYDGDLGRPNLYVPLSKESAESKAAHIGTHFGSQTQKPWFSDETFLSIMKLRGIEAGAPDQYAEAFYAPKLAVTLTP